MAVKQRTLQQGDTLVEVLMAIVVMSLVIVGAITMMNRGLASAQVSLEHSQVRLQINAQTELLTYLRDEYALDKTSDAADEWKSIVTTATTTPVDYGSACAVTAAKQTSAFYLNKSTGEVLRSAFSAESQPTTIATPGQGLWLESVKSSGTTPAYMDFVIRACWNASGSAGQQRTVTAVRLYDPSR